MNVLSTVTSFLTTATDLVGAALVVFGDDFDLAAVDAALLVRFLVPHLRRLQRIEAKGASGPDIGANMPIVISVSVIPGSAARALGPIRSSDVAIAAIRWRTRRVIHGSPPRLVVPLKITDQIGFQASSNAIAAGTQAVRAEAARTRRLLRCRNTTGASIGVQRRDDPTTEHALHVSRSAHHRRRERHWRSLRPRASSRRTGRSRNGPPCRTVPDGRDRRASGRARVRRRRGEARQRSACSLPAPAP